MSADPLMTAYVDIAANMAPLDKGLSDLPTKVSRAADKAAAAATKAAERTAAASQKAAEKAAIATQKANERAALASEKASERAAISAQKASDKAATAAERTAQRVTVAADKAAAAQDRANQRAAMSAQRTADKITMAVKNIPGNSSSQGDPNRKSSGFAQAGLGISRLFEDVSVAGPIGGLNNVPEVVRGIGQAAGLAAGPLTALVATASGLATVSFLVYQNWDKITDLFGLGKTQTEAEAMDELGKKTHKTADEMERLHRFKRMEGKVEELRTGMSEEDQETESLVTRAVAEHGLKNVMGVVQKHAPELLDQSGDVPAIHQKIADAEKEITAIKAGKFSGTGKFGTGGDSRAAALAAQEQAIRDAKAELPQARNKAAETIIASGAMPDLFPKNLEKITQAIFKGIHEGKGGDENTKDILVSLLEALPSVRKKEDQDWEAFQAGNENYASNKAMRKQQEGQSQKHTAKDAAEYHKVLAGSFDEDDEVARQFHVQQQEDKAARVKMTHNLKMKHGGDIMDMNTYLNKLQSGGLLKPDDKAIKVAEETKKVLEVIAQNTGDLHKLRIARYGK